MSDPPSSCTTDLRCGGCQMFVFVCVFTTVSLTVCDLLIYSTGMLMHKCFCLPSADSHSVFNGSHQSFSSNGNSKINNIAKTLQDSLMVNISSSSSSSGSGSGKQPLPQPSPPNMLNGRNSSTTEDCIYENIRTLGSQNLGDKTPPVPARSAHTNHTPVPNPRTSLSVASSSAGGGHRAQESPKLLRNVRSTPTPPSSGSGQGTENSSPTPKSSSVKFSPAAPPSPRVRGSSLQHRSPSPMREQGQFVTSVEVPQRLRTPELIGPSGLRELPPVSPYTSGKGTPGSQGSASLLATQGLAAKPHPESHPGPQQTHNKSRGHESAVLPESISTLWVGEGAWRQAD